MIQKIEHIKTEYGKAYVTSKKGLYLKLRFKGGSHGWAERSKVNVLTGEE